MSISKKNILILCTGNSCRSQMAEGILRHLYGDHYEVYSAGTHPLTVNLQAITVMKEINIDISHHYSKSVTALKDVVFDVVITVCGNAQENCPVISGDHKTLHWGFDDPVGQSMDCFREVRDLILEKFKTCNKELQS